MTKEQAARLAALDREYDQPGPLAPELRQIYNARRRAIVASDDVKALAGAIQKTQGTVVGPTGPPGRDGRDAAPIPWRHVVHRGKDGLIDYVESLPLD